MKKLLLILLSLVVISLSGCFQSVVIPNENSITLTLDDDFAYVTKATSIPSFTFEFDGTLNTNKNVDKKYYTVFTNNEDQILSDALQKLFNKYQDRMYVDVTGEDKVKTTLFSKLDEFGKVINEKYEPDDHKVYEETAYISLENGLKLTVDYRRFVYNGKNYYTWKYTASITMYLYYPLMKIEDNNENKLVIISLPNRISFQVGPQLVLSNLLNGSTYTDSNDCTRYTFNYLQELDEEGKDKLTLEDKQQYIIDYYVNEMNGIVDKAKNTITYTYLGNSFEVELLEKNFKMHYKG
ncbi:MAG: hypothetical protein SOU07_06805 [Bacilli bacterium]|nr:hypothetical protein [Acholeplasmataceae bacterium]MDY2903130.1 hypothetical protein [Bacilli bacterium]